MDMDIGGWFSSRMVVEAFICLSVYINDDCALEDGIGFVRSSKV